MTFGAETGFHSWFATSVYRITGIIEPAHSYDRHFVHPSYDFGTIMVLLEYRNAYTSYELSFA